MAAFNAQTEELISQIERAFRKVDRPQITLRVARGVDDNMWELCMESQRRWICGHSF